MDCHIKSCRGRTSEYFLDEFSLLRETPNFEHFNSFDFVLDRKVALKKMGKTIQSTGNNTVKLDSNPQSTLRKCQVYWVGGGGPKS